MILVETIVGNVHDEPWTAQARRRHASTSWRSTSGRPRRTASAARREAGAELAVALERNTHLHDGDVLAWDEPTRHRDRRPDRAAGRAGHPPRRPARPAGRDARADLLRAGPRPGQPALAGRGQGDDGLRPADRRPQGDGVGDEDARLRGHHLRIRRPGRRSSPTSPPTSPAACSAGPTRRRTRTCRPDLPMSHPVDDARDARIPIRTSTPKGHPESHRPHP